MLHGHIDSLTTSGQVEGWAFNEFLPLDPLCVAVYTEDKVEVAAGLANLFRGDLAEAQLAYGWCHFRLALKLPIEVVNSATLQLCELRTGIVIFTCDGLPVREVAPLKVRTLTDITCSDPTVLEYPEQLIGFEDLFQNFIRKYGVEAFARAAYLYIFCRTADDAGCSVYVSLLQNKQLSPYKMLLSMIDSEEYRVKARSPVAPNHPGFPFRTAL